MGHGLPLAQVLPSDRGVVARRNRSETTLGDGEDMSTSQKDREYMKRLGVYQAEGHAQRRSAHLALSVAERLRRSLALSATLRRSLSGTVPTDDPTPLYDRARDLGLYRP